MRSNIPVRVKNSYNPKSPGTVIQAFRDKSNSLVTAITSKSGNVLGCFTVIAFVA
jgi:aspartokinase